MESIASKENGISIKVRLGSMLLDHFIMGFVIVPPLILISLVFKPDDPFETSPIESVAFFVMMVIYFNKDYFNGRSVAKRVLGFQIIDRKTSQPANQLKCFLRNITIPLWPLEVIISFISPTRRLGDLIANTRIQEAGKEDAAFIFKDLKQVKLNRLTLLTFLISFIYLGVLWYVMENLMGL